MSQDLVVQGRRATVLSAALAATAALAAPAGAAPRDPGEGAPRGRLDRLYAEAERATETYNGTRESVDRLRRRIAGLRDRIARGEQHVSALRDELAGLAGAQYRSGGLDPAVQLFLSADPEGYLENALALDRAGARGAARLAELQEAGRRLDQQRREAGADLERLEASRALLARHKRAVQSKLARAGRLLVSLTPAERAAYGRSSRGGDRVGGPAGPGALSGLDLPASPRAALALAAARSVLGRPYVWGASGPDSFDCSGLVQWAYGRAGVSLPRTSQQQRFAGRRVPLSQARPGDLVVYRQDASHVALYVGRGQVIHAPHPGAGVRYDPVGMMPVTSVTRV